MTPTARSLKHLRERGYVAEVVERFNRFSCRRNDLFGCLDIVGVREGETLGVQSTTASNMGARVKKILAEPKAQRLRDAGWKIIVHGWHKTGARGKRKLWTLKEREV